MELLKAQREGREEQFRAEEAQKRKALRVASLDAEMDEYFKNRNKPAPPSKEQPATTTDPASNPDPKPAAEASRDDDAQPAATT